MIPGALTLELSVLVEVQEQAVVPVSFHRCLLSVTASKAPVVGSNTYWIMTGLFKMTLPQFTQHQQPA